MKVNLHQHLIIGFSPMQVSFVSGAVKFRLYTVIGKDFRLNRTVRSNKHSQFILFCVHVLLGDVGTTMKWNRTGCHGQTKWKWLYIVINAEVL
jgi:hypothetical protein